MQRRNFVKLGLIAPFFIYSSCREKQQGTIKEPLIPDSTKSVKEQIPKQAFEVIEVDNIYRVIGFESGKRFKANIMTALEARGNWLKNLVEYSTSGPGKNYSDKLFEITKKYFPDLIDELKGYATGSGLTFQAVWAMAIQSELNAYKKENPGCSTIYYKDEKNSWLFHNEDGDQAYYGKMYVLRAMPPSGVGFTTLVYPGMIPGVGPSMNSEGVIETTNFIGCTKPEEGIPRYFLGRAILEAKNLNEALEIASMAPRAFPWHHNLASIENNQYVSIETLPDGTIEKRTIDKGFYLHTNHTTGKKTENYKYQGLDYKKSSSIPRYEVLSAKN